MRNDLSWHTATVVSMVQVTPSIREFLILPETGIRHWTPGSHINVSVSIAGQPALRSYSLIGSPETAGYRIAVKLVDNSRGGSRYMWSLAAGARLSVSAPRNHFELSTQVDEVLLIAGGIGVTPIVSMAQALQGSGARVKMLYAARGENELAYLADLRTLLGERLQVFIDEAGQRMDLASEFAQLGAAAETYICGPLPLLDAARSAWAHSARPPSALRYETFGNSGRFAPQSFSVNIPRHNLQIVVAPEQTLLDALTEAGVAVLSDCKRGECGLCMVDVLAAEGELDHRDVFLSAEQRAEGKRLCACVSRAVGGCLTLDSAFRSEVPV